jgi:hypothetical protein
MKQALRIFRKDVRHLWPQIALVVAVEVAVSGAALGMDGTSPARNVMGVPLVLAVGYLIAALVHEEKAHGNQQYWVTRPISWQAVVAAKALFAIAFLWLPGMAIGFAGLVVFTRSPMEHLPGLLASGFLGLSSFILPVAALAAITSSLVQMVWAVIGTWVGWLVLARLMLHLWTSSQDWGGLEWWRTMAVAAAGLVVFTAIVAFQYARRRTRLARGLMVSAMLASGFIPAISGSHLAFALQQKIMGRRVSDHLVQISFDEARERSQRSGTSVAWVDALRVQLPIRVTGMPAGRALMSEGAKVTIESPNGERSVSSWDARTRLNSDGASRNDNTVLPGDGQYWWDMAAEGVFYGRHSFDHDIRVHATLALTLLSEEEITPLVIRQGMQPVPHDGRCWIALREQYLNATCTWPGRTPARVELRIHQRATDENGTTYEVGPTLRESPPGSYAPFPVSGVWQWVNQSTSLATAPKGILLDAKPTSIELVTRWPEAWFERELDIPKVGDWFRL